ncbi:MAG: lamin tail domain-containing protein, partial [Bacteroidales bacterium]|nr:lamin tail domain-containing protein [Bacteroidales bacterium]
MKKGLLLIAVFFIVVFASAQTDLFFSEYCEGSGNNKGLEIYNPTSQTINLNDYWVVRYSNGSSVFTEGGVTQLQGSLEPYETHVLVNGQTTST